MRVFPPLRGGLPQSRQSRRLRSSKDIRLMPAYGWQETLTAGSGSDRSETGLGVEACGGLVCVIACIEAAAMVRKHSDPPGYESSSAPRSKVAAAPGADDVPDVLPVGLGRFQVEGSARLGNDGNRRGSAFPDPCKRTGDTQDLLEALPFSARFQPAPSRTLSALHHDPRSSIHVPDQFSD